MTDGERAAGAPAAFLSYARADDRHEDGRVSELRQRLSGAIRVATGEDFPIFQDRYDIGWGQQWKARIVEALDSVTFLIPVVTPSFIRSGPCRDEVARFLERERRLGRGDLIRPIYYVSVPELDDRGPDAGDWLLRLLRAREHVDWRELRFEAFESPGVRRALDALATQVRDSLSRRTGTRPLAGTPGVQGRDVTYRTHVVDPLGRGSHLTITAALRTATAGDRVVVRPGFYPEAIVLHTPLELVGAGRVGDVVVRAADRATLEFRAAHGRVTGLTLRGSGTPEDHGTVEITAGRLELEGCDISSTRSCAVSVRDGADPRVRGNRISGGSGRGIWVRDDGAGVIEDNDILDSARSGIAIESGANPTVRGNRIRGGEGPGIFVHRAGAGVIEGNDITGNASVGVAIESGGNPIVRHNNIHDGRGAGIRVYADGAGTIEDNDIVGNVQSGIEIASGGHPIVRANRIRGGKGRGIWVRGAGTGVIEDNDIVESGRSGIAIESGANPTVRGNRIRGGEGPGIFVHDDGAGVIEDNDITGNAIVGIRIESGGNPTVRRNRIHENRGAAVFESGGRGTIEDNDLRNNAKGAWMGSFTNITRARNQV